MIKLSASVYLFISPHLDDVVFSCGGYAYRLAASGKKVIIATVFTADDSSAQPTSWLAKRYSRGWNLGDNPFAARRQEDLVAARSLGVQAVHLGFLDAIYRRDADGMPLYTRTVTNFPPHAHDWQILEPALQATLRDLKERSENERVVMICPLGVGGHVDHLIVRQAVEAISDPQDRLYYEDFPYSIQADGLDSSRVGEAHRTRGLHPVLIRLNPAEADARQRAMACYPSQVPGCFPSEVDRAIEILRARLPLIGDRLNYSPNLSVCVARMNARVSAYIARVGGERYWLQSDGQIPVLDGS